MAPSQYHQPHSSTSPCIRLACQDVSQTCSLPPVTHRPSVGQITSYSSISAAPMCMPPPEKAMQAVISHLVPQATIQQVQAVSSIHCQRAYGVKVSDGTSLVLVVPPPPMVKLLRSERASVISEAAVLKWLANKGPELPLLQERTPEPEEDVHGTNAAVVKGVERLEKSIDDTAEDLRSFLPTLISHTAASNEAGREYNLMRPTLGAPIPELTPPLSPSERKRVDFQTGQFYRRLCKLVSPTGRFGPAFAVLPPAAAAPSAEPTRPTRRDVNARMLESRGVQSWSTAFHSMLEAVLRDGEDMQVMLGYGTIRRHFKRFQYALDEVATPRLVAVDVGKDVNTLVLRRRCRGNAVSPASSRRASIQESGPRQYDGLDSDDDSASELEEVQQVILYNQSDIIMAGMKDWSNFVFGDPLFAVNFCRGPSSEFLSGFDGNTVDEGADLPVFSADMIEDKASAHVRLLLYQCYHAVTHIVREFFRPRKDSSGRELEARKKLNNILAQLDALDDVGNQRCRRPSGEVSQAKRPKSGGKDD